MADLFIFYYFLPLLFAFLWFRNLVWLLENLKLGKDTKLPKTFGAGSILSMGLVFSILLSIYLSIYLYSLK